MLVSFSIVPMGVGEGLSDYVARMMEIIDEAGLDYRMGPMETTVEGEPDEVMALIMKCHAEMRKTARRVLTSIKIDDRDGAEGRIKGKIADVEKKLGREVRK
ncbi:MAG: MTH1187 family thiamine-binding protein [Bacteroidales bacterium]|nr:MTH1187 family thiamine-binding protein [Candidatus Latescibacterota bacterium]